MRKMGLNKNYVVAIFDDPKFASRNMTIQEKRKEITEFFTRFKYFGPIIYGNSVNDVLDKALEHDVEYCVVQAVGHIVRDGSFFKIIEKWMDKKNFFVTGHIMDKETPNSNWAEGNGYYGLHKQCILVNLNYYKKFDKPVWGEAKHKLDKPEHLAAANRHAKDIHDDYTPLAVMPTEETKVCTPLVDGWNFINTSLENGLTVYNFHPKIRDAKEFVYPTSSIEDLQTQLSWVNNIVNYAPQCVFLWNTETYLDLKYCKIQEPVRHLYTLAASFKPHIILNTFNFEDDAIVNFYDYSKPALAYKKMMLKQWNGEDYPAFINWARKKYQFNETHGTLTEHETDDFLWQREISWWGGEDRIKEHWKRYKRLKHTWTHVDISKDCKPITSRIVNEPGSVIWWSNAFHTVNAHYLHGLRGVTSSYKTWIDEITKQNPNIWILGKDFLDRPVEGGQIKDYVIKS